ncbi:MAG TPA: SpoIIE family protein phosphatase [Candidatus Acidoferrales bacterium]|jgi:serine phosphatase RsbU (regulator of sigma subunit)|nr:SpoIIE family protein phosphatase [Candidatus Acidoferrales bacterium]
MVMRTVWAGPATEYEREEARQIQLSLLPAGPLAATSHEIAFRFSPFGGVGGDFADFFMLPNGLVGLYIGDVVGKGISAALYAALVMGLIRGVHKEGTDPATALAVLNRRMLVRPVPGRFASTLYATFDPLSLKLTFSNAGIPLPLIASSSGCAAVGGGGLPSGLFPCVSYENYSVQLAPGDAVLFASDGLHELRDRYDADFSHGRLAEIWQHSYNQPAEESLVRLFEEAHAFCHDGSEQRDDITALVLRVPT